VDDAAGRSLYEGISGTGISILRFAIALKTELRLKFPATFRAFQPDGVILFSDILTPLREWDSFDIIESGAVIEPPIRSQEQIDQLHPLEPEESRPEILQTLRREVGNRAAVLGFVGAPLTLAAYAIGKAPKTISAWRSQNRPCCINLGGRRDRALRSLSNRCRCSSGTDV